MKSVFVKMDLTFDYSQFQRVFLTALGHIVQDQFPEEFIPAFGPFFDRKLKKCLEEPF